MITIANHKLFESKLCPINVTSKESLPNNLHIASSVTTLDNQDLLDHWEFDEHQQYYISQMIIVEDSFTALQEELKQTNLTIWYEPTYHLFVKHTIKFTSQSTCDISTQLISKYITRNWTLVSRRLESDAHNKLSSCAQILRDSMSSNELLILLQAFSDYNYCSMQEQYAIASRYKLDSLTSLIEKYQSWVNVSDSELTWFVEKELHEFAYHVFSIASDEILEQDIISTYDRIPLLEQSIDISDCI